MIDPSGHPSIPPTAPPSVPLIAEDLLRVMLAEGEGSLPRRGLREKAGAARRLDVSLRAALFCDLVRGGHLTGMHGPEPAGAGDDTVRDNPDTAGGTSGSGDRRDRHAPSSRPDATGRELGSDVPSDRMLAAVLKAVERRPALAWRRWFRHIRDDRATLVDRFVRSGGWQAQGGSGFTDTDPDGLLRLHSRAFRVAELIEAPTDEREIVLGYLYALTGPRLTSERLLGWEARLGELDAAPAGPTLRRVLRAAQFASRPKRLRPR